MRVTLADKKVCRTKTTGLGQECSSRACGGGAEGGREGGITACHFKDQHSSLHPMQN